jgi:hypothetical protein
MWYHNPEGKNPEEFPAVLRTSNEKRNAHRAMDINNVAICEQHS